MEDCRACKAECRRSSKCGGVECGLSGKHSGKCTWWSYESCGRVDLQTYYSPTRITCMKYGEGNIQKHRIFCQSINILTKIMKIH